MILYHHLNESVQWFTHLYISSKTGIEKGGDHFGGADTDHVAVSGLLSLRNATSELWDSVNHSAHNTGSDNDVLIGVVDVEDLGDLTGESGDIAMSVDDVGSLSQLNVGNVELGGVLGKPDLVGIKDGEGGAHTLGKTGLALTIEVGSATIDESEEDSFVVNGVVTDESLSLLRGGLLELFGSESSALKVWSSL